MKKKTTSTKLKSLSSQSLSQSADAYYTALDYKNALPRYDRIYKESKDEFAKERLVHCLIERIKQLQEKNMFSEACALFVHLQKVDSTLLPIDDYFICLIQAGQHEKASQLCINHAVDISMVSENMKSNLVAASLLDSSLYPLTVQPYQQDILSAKTFFALMDEGVDNERLISVLNTISLRSPLKGLRLVIQSLIIFKSNPLKSRMLAQEISADSPYYSIAEVIIVASKPSVELFYDMPCLSTSQLALLQQLKGWSKQQLATLSKTASLLLKQQSALKKIKCLLELSSRIPEGVLKPICLSLYDGKSSTWKLLVDHFGNESFIRAKFKALEAEKGPEVWDAIECWDDCIDVIKSSKNLPLQQIGLIRIHQFQLVMQRCCQDHKECISWLKESLEYFPDRKETYIAICNWCKEVGEKKLYNQWINKMEKQFPCDIEVLLASAEASLQKQAYVKAISILKKALKVDSINSSLKRLLARAYLERGFVFLGTKEIDNAVSALENAKAFEQYLTPGLIPIGQTILELSRSNQSAFNESLSLAYKQAGNKLLVNYLFAYYVTEFKIKSMNFEHLLVWDAPDELAFIKLTEGLVGIKEHLDNNGIKKLLCFENIKELNLQIAGAIKQVLRDEDFILLCDLFYRLKFFASLILAANSALKHYKKSALFTYYKIQGQIKGNPKNIKDKQYHELIDALHSIGPDSASSDTAVKIARLLEAADKFRRPSFLDLPFSNNMFDMLEDLIG